MAAQNSGSRRKHRLSWSFLVLLVLLVVSGFLSENIYLARFVRSSPNTNPSPSSDDKKKQGTTDLTFAKKDSEKHPPASEKNDTAATPRTANKNNEAIDEEEPPDVRLRIKPDYLKHPETLAKNVWEEDHPPAEFSWNSSQVLPHWFRHYVKWHQDQRQLLMPSNWNTSGFQYLVQRCTISEACGGGSDRLLGIPFKVAMAARSKRLFFIIWQRPCPLEEFLVAPSGGLDWRPPGWLQAAFLSQMSEKPRLDSEDMHSYVQALNGGQATTNTTMLDVRFGATLYVEDWYNSFKNKSEASFQEVYHDIWSTLFQPSPAVQRRIDSELQKLELQPGKYDSLHIRAQYAQLESDDGLVQNATNCALFGHPSFSNHSPPLYIATDTPMVSIKASQHAQNYNWTAVIRNTTGVDPIHLDRGSNFLEFAKSNLTRGLPPSAYYDTFVDLYLLANSRCSTFGRGGFGRWAQLVGPNSDCTLRYWRPGYYFPKERCAPPKMV
jgi:hypothetical protein